jgi:WD40 repeat protein
MKINVGLRWMITVGSDGHVLVWDLKDGSSREFGGGSSSGRDAYDTGTAQPSTSTGRTGGSRRSRRNSKDNVGAECIWKVGFSEGGEVCALMMKKDGKTVMEFWDMRGR